MSFATPAWDLALFRFLNDTVRADVLDVLAPVLSASWVLVVLGALAFAVTGLRRRPDVAAGLLCVVAALGAADFSAGRIKDAAGRVRPHNSLAHVHYMEDGEWRQRPADFAPLKDRGSSYVSAHAANTMAVAVSSALLWPVVRPWIFLLPLLVGWSRIYLGKHFPTDVAGGWLTGIVAAGLVWVLWELWVAPLLRKRFPRWMTARTG